MTQYFKQQNTI